MSKTIALLVTLDTKHQEAGYLKEQIEARGHKALLFDIGVIGKAGIGAEYPREKVAEAGGGNLAQLLQNPTREEAGPVYGIGLYQYPQGVDCQRRSARSTWAGRHAGHI